MAAHSSVLSREIPWTEELGGLQSMGLKKLDMTEGLTKHAPAPLPNFISESELLKLKR